MERSFNVGYTEINDFEIVGIKGYNVVFNGGIEVNYRNGKSRYYNGSSSAINVIKVICDAAIANSN